MADIRVTLDPWQQEALFELARSRGVGVEAMARTLLNERLVERAHCAFDDLLSGKPILGASYTGEAGGDSSPSRDTIEERLKRLFAD